jgi:hypothetical protein
LGRTPWFRPRITPSIRQYIFFVDIYRFSILDLSDQ